jgi:hypothetical protein
MGDFHIKNAVLNFSESLFLHKAWWRLEAIAVISGQHNNFNICCTWRTLNKYIFVIWYTDGDILYKD